MLSLSTVRGICFSLSLLALAVITPNETAAQTAQGYATGIFVFEDSSVGSLGDHIETGASFLAVSEPNFGTVEIAETGELVYLPLSINQELNDEFVILALEHTNGLRVVAGSFNPISQQFSLSITRTFSGLVFAQDIDPKEVARKIFEHFGGDPKTVVDEIVKLDNVGGGRDTSIPRNGHEIATATELFDLLAKQEGLTSAERRQLAAEIEDLKGFRNRLRALENGQQAGAAAGGIVTTVLIDALTRKAAFRRAKRDAGIGQTQEPKTVRKVPMTGKDGKPILDENKKPIMTREYVFNREDGTEIVIQDHGAGHTFGEPGGVGDQGPHFNVRPGENPRTGKVPGTDPHYPFDDKRP